eukprot:5896125-Amphidinium_carterae.1
MRCSVLQDLEPPDCLCTMHTLLVLSCTLPGTYLNTFASSRSSYCRRQEGAQTQMSHKTRFDSMAWTLLLQKSACNCSYVAS